MSLVAKSVSAMEIAAGRMNGRDDAAARFVRVSDIGVARAKERSVNGIEMKSTTIRGGKSDDGSETMSTREVTGTERASMDRR